MKRILIKYIIGLSILTLGSIPNKGSAQVFGKDLLKKNNKLEINFSYIQGFIILDIQLQYVIPLKFIFDTGAQNTIIFDRKITDFIKTNYSKEISIAGADYSKTVKALIARNMTLSPHPNKGPNIERDVIVLKDNFINLSELIGYEVHGIIGANFFKGLVVELDYNTHKLTLHNPDNYPRHIIKNHVTIPLEIKDEKPYFYTSITSNGTKADSIRMLLDTGASISVMLQTDADTSIYIPDNVLKGSLGKGLGGDIMGYIGRVEHLKIHEDITITRPISYFQNVGYSDDTFTKDGLSRDGLIGNFILERMHIVIDYPNQNLYLRKNKNFDENFDYDRSGLNVIASGSKLRNFVVTNVIKDSPAYIAGLLPGDEILKINRLPHFFLNLERISKLLSSKKKSNVTLTIKRNNQVFKKSLTLKDLV